jgi:hypothetical protein
MRIYRRRRREGERYVRIPLRVTEVDTLIRMGLLTEERRQDEEALQTAIKVARRDAMTSPSGPLNAAAGDSNRLGLGLCVSAVTGEVVRSQAPPFLRNRTLSKPRDPRRPLPVCGRCPSTPAAQYRLCIG